MWQSNFCDEHRLASDSKNDLTRNGCKVIRISVTLFALNLFIYGCGGGGGGGGGSGGEPANARPNASITVANTTGYSPFTVSFDASQSTDSDGSINTYSWDFGDGGNANTLQADHTYTGLGSYTATLTVTDNDGATSTATTTINVHAQVAGLYTGDFLSNVPGGTFTTVFVHVATNQKLYAYESGLGLGGCDVGYSGDIIMNADLATSTLLAELLNPVCTFPDGTMIGTIDVIATVVARNSITDTYIGVGDNGTLQLSYIPELSERGSSLADIAGVWSYSDGLGYMDTMVVQNNGDFVSTDTDGCVLTGRFALIDTSLNEYYIEYDLSCPAGIKAAGDGRREGIAFIDDFFFIDDWLEWNITFLEGPLAGRQGGGALSRPAASPATSEISAASEFSVPKSVQRDTVRVRNRWY